MADYYCETKNWMDNSQWGHFEVALHGQYCHFKYYVPPDDVNGNMSWFSKKNNNLSVLCVVLTAPPLPSNENTTQQDAQYQNSDRRILMWKTNQKQRRILEICPVISTNSRGQPTRDEPPVRQLSGELTNEHVT
jgi:hypothetical protein